MTNLQEAKLAREAELCYVTIAMVTDYDCWHPHHDSVTVDQIVAALVKNAENAAKVVKATVGAMPKTRACKCGAALAHAILTERDKIPASTREKLKLILREVFESVVSAYGWNKKPLHGLAVILPEMHEHTGCWVCCFRYHRDTVGAASGEHSRRGGYLLFLAASYSLTFEWSRSSATIFEGARECAQEAWSGYSRDSAVDGEDFSAERTVY